MSRTKNAKRKRDAKEYIPNKASKQSSTTLPSNVVTPPPDTNNDDAGDSKYEPKSLQTLISEEELEVAVDTLKTLTKYPSAIKAKGAKELRAAVYDFRMACTTGMSAGGGEFFLLSNFEYESIGI
jgi:hypothetical protein